MQLRAKLICYVGTDALIDLEFAPFVVPDPKLRLRGATYLVLSIDAKKPAQPGLYQARYRARPCAARRGLYIFEDEARTAKNVVVLAPEQRPPAVVYVTLSPGKAPPAELAVEPIVVEDEAAAPEGAPCLPNCDPMHIYASFLEQRDAR